MRLKSYYATSVAEAIENARGELGPEAMLLNSREVSPEQRHLGAYEVVFGITGEPLLPRRSDAVAHLFTPPAVEEAPAVIPTVPAVRTRATSPLGLNVQPVQAPIAPAEIPAWKKTLEELVAKQEAPIPVSSIPKARPAATSFKTVAKPPAPVAAPVPLPPPVKPAAPTVAALNVETPAQPEVVRRPRVAAELTPPSPEMLADELVNLRQQIERVKSSLAFTNQQPTPSSRPRELDLLITQMTNLGFSSTFAQKMADAAVERLSAFSSESASLSFLNRSGYSLERLQQVLVAELQSRFKVKSEIGVPGTGRQVMMLVGPPGAGKTTTLVKLAVKCGLEKRTPVHLLSLDTVRIGGPEQLATFARILNVGFDALHTTAALGEALADCRTDQLVLIDCPGYAPGDMEQAAATASFLRQNPSIDVQLVLPAVMHASSLQAASQRFASFDPSKLIFTHLDEVDSLGTVLEHAIKCSLPVSFLTNGQGIPQDLQEAVKDRFTQGILNGAAAFGAA